MTAIGWNEANPSQASITTLVDDEIRSMQTNISGGLSESFNWPGTGAGSLASAGEAEPGSLRFSHASSVATDNPDGFLRLDPRRVTLHHTGQIGYSLGHANMLEQADGTLDVPYRQHWLVQEGSYSTDTAVTAIAFGSAYSGTPTVFLVGDSTAVLSGLSNLDTSGFTSIMSHIGSGATPTVNFKWRSEGSRAI